jgi:hypothetical protein
MKTSTRKPRAHVVPFVADQRSRNPAAIRQEAGNPGEARLMIA